ncbi:MAG TPA: regulatory iron-sulfur-containing complex subunit RicT [Candidatus Polarisedimenticolia bacterium]|nr:regulatory iron-sulfur-containing complex subunit RicT [Candidatus Polarisedimenticolia bacterium]
METPPTDEPAASSAPPPAPAAGCGCDDADKSPDGTVAVVGVRLSDRVRVVQFNARGLDLELGESVVVESDRGYEVGEVAQATTRSRRGCSISCMKSVLRRASEDDVRESAAQHELETSALAWCRERVRERSLGMRLVRVEQVPETKKLVFLFTADGRVDFRELVRDLASHFRTRIEMRQVGVRDEAGALGGYGPCGRTLCCSTFLKGFAPISIKMAKAQKLSLNPSKLSGMCGRLKCCLRYEYEPPGGETVAPEDEPLPA